MTSNFFLHNNLMYSFTDTPMFSNETMYLSGYYIAPYGYPGFLQILKRTVEDNHLVPELLEKKIRLLWGNGPCLYQRDIKDNQIIKTLVEDKEVLSWLNNWDWIEYLHKCVHEYYYFESVWTKLLLAKKSRIGPAKFAKLENISQFNIRLASDKPNASYTQNPDLFKTCIIGDFANHTGEFNAMVLHDKDTAGKQPVSVFYAQNKSLGEPLYAFNSWYRGLINILKGSNRIPRHINSFLENSLSAKYHIIIPIQWREHKKTIIEAICVKNADYKSRGMQLIESVDGVPVGTVFSESIVDEVVKKYLERISSMMSGPDNAGKFFSSYSFCEDGKEFVWKIEEIPMKYKEFMESLEGYHKRADGVITMSIGVDPSLSNIGAEGLFGKSGSDTLYNYKIYKDQLAIPEMIICKALNYALSVNFPGKNIHTGFYHNVINREETVSPANRIINNL